MKIFRQTDRVSDRVKSIHELQTVLCLFNFAFTIDIFL